MRVLNLYSGLGGNRKMWPDCHVVAVEMDERIAQVYKESYPLDDVVIGDAHQYLLENHQEFDFIWSSPPCQSHSKMIRSGKNRAPRYPDMMLYEEILLLKHDFKGKWVVENVVPYYEPMLSPFRMGRHLFWSNFKIWKMPNEPHFPGFINSSSPEDIERMKDWLGVDYEGNIYYQNNHDPAQVLRNCVHPRIGEHIFNCMLEDVGSQLELI